MSILLEAPEIELNAEDVEGSANPSVLVSEEVMNMIHQNFADCPNIVPVLSVGSSSCSRSAVLDAILSRERRQVEKVFSSKGRKLGVIVWPYPVRFGDVNLLLIKMWNVNFQDDEDPLRRISDKVLSALLCLTSVCLVSAENNILLPTLEAVQSLYVSMKQPLSLSISKFVVFAESEAQYGKIPKKKLRELQNSSEWAVTKFLFRGKRGISENCVDELLRLLANPTLHASFLALHQGIKQNIKVQNASSSIVVMLTSLMRLVNLNLGYRSFMDRIPRFTSNEFEQQMKQLDEIETCLKHLKSAKALEFIEKFNDSYSLNSATVTTLIKGYDPQKPTIVMAIIGNAGMGKSTLLNNIIQQVTGCEQLPNLFKTGSTLGQTTRESQVLSQPLNFEGIQLMLMDLEGLEGTEINSMQQSTLQMNLVSAILTLV